LIIFFADQPFASISPHDNVILQQEYNDCGPATFAMVFESMGPGYGYETIRARFTLTDEGASMQEMVRVAGSFGRVANAWRLNTRSLSGLSGPAILLVDSNHYIVLDSADGSYAYTRDPSRGILRLSYRALRERWGGETIVFEQYSPTP
jgi:ATP-binding cassette subfamily B protein RaxB